MASPYETDNAITPEPLTFPLTGSCLTINANCGMCHHFARSAHPAYKKVCKEKGIIDTNKPCSRFKPDPRQVRFADDAALIGFADFLSTIKSNKLQILASLINQEARTRRYGYNFGEIVYVLSFGPDYLSNYRRCRVISADKDTVMVEGKGGFVGTFMAPSILTAKKWKKKKKQLIADKRVRDPKYRQYFRAPTQAEIQVKQIVAELQPIQLDEISGSVKNTKLIASSLEGGFKRIGKSKAKINYADLDRFTPLDALVRTRGGQD